MIDRRMVLEAIVGAPDVSAAERLRALELLNELAPEATSQSFKPEIAAMDVDALDRALDEFVGVEIVADAVRGDTSRFPIMAAAIRREVTRLVEDRVGELVDLVEREREIERRAAQRADELYVARGLAEAQEALACAAAAAERPPEEKPPRAIIAAEEDSHPGLRFLREWGDGEPPSPFRR